MTDDPPVGVEITDEAVTALVRKLQGVRPDWMSDEGWQNCLDRHRAALVAARPFMTSRPALDRRQVEEALFPFSIGDRRDYTAKMVEAVMALAVPVPTEEELVEAISARLHITTDLIADGGKPRHLSADTSAVVEAARAVLALLNGSVK